jgi:threonine dehydratase
MVDLHSIEDAYRRICNHIIHTPVMTSTTINQMTRCQVFFKCENLQRAGAFKFRGAYNTLTQLNSAERKRGVIAHSSGNHAQAVALAAKLLDIKATIVMPKNSSPVKIKATQGYGAEVIHCDSTVEARVEVTQQLIDKHNYVLIHPYNDARIISGAGTAALELINESGPLDLMVAPVGGGGLISGTALATKGLSPKTQVIAVEPKGADDAYRSFKSGTLIPSRNPRTIADGLLTSLGDLTFKIIKQNVDDIITVSESEILNAMRLHWERMKLIVEPSGAVPLAGVLQYCRHHKNQRVGVIISGGNVDISQFFQHLEQLII